MVFFLYPVQCLQFAGLLSHYDLLPSFELDEKSCRREISPFGIKLMVFFLYPAKNFFTQQKKSSGFLCSTSFPLLKFDPNQICYFFSFGMLFGPSKMLSGYHSKNSILLHDPSYVFFIWYL